MLKPHHHQSAQVSGLILAEDIAAATTFCDLERLRREFQRIAGLEPEERRLMEDALAAREHDLIELYRFRL